MATLYHQRFGWSKYVAELRVSVARSLQHQGLGTAITLILVRQAIAFGVG